MAHNGCLTDICSVLEANDIPASRKDTILAWAASVCAIIDQTIEADNDMAYVECKISEGNLTITLEYDCFLSMEDGASHPFFDIIRKFDKFRFSTDEVDKLKITLVKNIMCGN